MWGREELDRIQAEWNEDCADWEKDAEDDGQPDEAQEWRDFDDQC